MAGIDRSLPTVELGAAFDVAGDRLRVLMVISRPSRPADVPDHIIEVVVTETIRAAAGQEHAEG